MIEVLDRIERELVVAVRRSNARRRRRRGLGIFAGCVAAVGMTTGAGIAAVTGTPIDRLLGGDTRAAKPADAPRLDLRLTDDGGLGWTVTTYRSRIGQIATAIASDRERAAVPQVSGRDGWTIAVGREDVGPVSGIDLRVVRSRGADHYALGGTVDAEARDVAVTIGGERRAAQLTDETASAPVVAPEGLTARGRELTRRLPPEIRVRGYAVTFAPGAFAGVATGRATVETTFADGTVRRQRSGVLCLRVRCDADPGASAEPSAPGRAG